MHAHYDQAYCVMGLSYPLSDLVSPAAAAVTSAAEVFSLCRRPYHVMLHAVFLNNCASSMSFSIFTHNDAGTGSGGAVYRYALPLICKEQVSVAIHVLRICGQTLR